MTSQKPILLMEKSIIAGVVGLIHFFSVGIHVCKLKTDLGRAQCKIKLHTNSTVNVGHWIEGI